MFVPRGIRPVARVAGTVSVCWAAKGGSGTTVVVAALGLTMQPPVLLVDLAGDLPATYGLAEPPGPGAHDWLRSDAGPEELTHLAVDVVAGLQVIPAGSPSADPEHPRWADLAAALTADHRTVVVDAGTGVPPAALCEAGRSLLVTRACYLSLRRAAATHHRPDAVVLVEEPGRSLRAGDVETALGAPVIASPAIDPAVARAVDAGLLAARLPHGVRRDLRGAA